MQNAGHEGVWRVIEETSARDLHFLERKPDQVQREVTMQFRDSRPLVKLVAITDIGRRKQNEDAYGIYSDRGCLRSTRENDVHVDHLPHSGTLVLVSDGMGGANAGEVASRMVVEGMIRAFQETESLKEVLHPSQRLARAVEVVNQGVYRAATGEYAGMGATLSALFLHGSVGFFAQVGDSRIYLIRNNRVTQLTRDQTVVQDLVDSGLIRPEQAAYHPQRNLLTQAMGTGSVVLPALGAVRFAPGDRVLLCTDGLSGKVGGKDYLAVMEETVDNSEMAARLLVDTSLARCGEDNITLVIAEIGNGPAPPSEVPKVLPFSIGGFGPGEAGYSAFGRIGT